MIDYNLTQRAFLYGFALSGNADFQSVLLRNESR
jgi:hypothetical protein